MRQTLKGEATVFFEVASDALVPRLAGAITPQRSRDDDDIGFVLGDQNGEMN